MLCAINLFIPYFRFWNVLFCSNTSHFDIQLIHTHKLIKQNKKYRDKHELRRVIIHMCIAFCTCWKFPKLTKTHFGYRILFLFVNSCHTRSKYCIALSNKCINSWKYCNNKLLHWFDRLWCVHFCIISNEFWPHKNA